MYELVGQIFALAQERYRVTDVRRLNGEAMVYAEELDQQHDHQSNSRRPRRTAFRYADIASLVRV